MIEVGEKDLKRKCFLRGTSPINNDTPSSELFHRLIIVSPIGHNPTPFAILSFQHHQTNIPTQLVTSNQ